MLSLKIRDLNTGYCSLRVIVASQSFHRHCKKDRNKKQNGISSKNKYGQQLLQKGPPAGGWVPSEAPAFRYIRSSIGNKRVESCCNNEAMRLEPYNYALVFILHGLEATPKVSCIALMCGKDIYNKHV